MKVSDSVIKLNWGDDGETIEIFEVLITPMGSGVGTKLVEAVRAYCDAVGKELRIVDATNPEFWRRFPWLGELTMDFESNYTGDLAIEFWYTPESFLAA